MSFATRSFLFAGAACALTAVFPASRAHADTLSWGTSGYTYNSSQAGAAATPGTAGTVNGNTVTIQYGNSTYFSNSTLNPNSPASPAVGTYGSGSNAYYANGGTTGASALQIIADFDNTSGNVISGSSIPVTFFFAKPVSNLTFTFYDVDNGTFGGSPYNDAITNIFGLATGGGATPQITLSPGGTGTTYSTGANSFTATGNNAQSAAGGNATVTFDSTPISQFGFIYTDTAANPNNTTFPAHSTLQIIALSNLTFNTVPEPSTWACFGAAGAMALWTLRRRTRRTVG